MKIDLQIQPEMLTNPDFLDSLHRACWQLSQPKMVHHLCLHEAGHMLYFQQMCLELKLDIEEIHFIGPTITQEGEKFEFTPAGVATPFKSQEFLYTSENLLLLAKGAVAGGVILRDWENVPIKESGDSEDDEVLKPHYDKAMRQPIQAITWGKLWNDAREAVHEDLQQKAIEQRIRKDAAELEAKHFSLRGST